MNKISFFVFNNILFRITKFPFFLRRLFLLFIDLFSIFLVVSFANLLLNQLSIIDLENIFYDSIIFASICLPIYFLSGQYKALTKFSTNSHIFYCLSRNILAVLIISSFRSSNFLYFFFIAITQAFLSFSTRIFLSNLIGLLSVSEKKKIVIYGAGVAGAKLVNSLLLNRENKILFFIDDDPNLWSRSIIGIPIKNPAVIDKFENQIDILCLAIPTLSQNRKKFILNKIYNFSFKVKVLPSLDEIISGNAQISETRSVEIEDLISRDIAKLDKSRINNTYNGKTILITGGGGSIGQEITKQIFSVNPKRIIIMDFCEYNLYLLKNELFEKSNVEVDIVFILGNCCDQKLINNLFKEYRIEILIHCAAYKHVPLVEINPIIGLANNILSTKILTDAAIKFNLDKAILISTDKAVRPTNVMGASKRVAELIFANAQEIVLKNKNYLKTKFSVVRFGNVLGSSGSVIPYFIKQIKEGGPVTITHPEITRYFMTIKEATILVLEASSFSKGGELFLLDMGEPLKILDLAKKLIKLNGLEVKNSSNKKGDIEIKFIGLRQGEKLFEELLIDGESEKTDNKYIFIGKESKIKLDKIKIKLINDLMISLINQKKIESIKILKELVPEWKQKIV